MATRGERTFARLIEAKLEDDYYAWYDVPVTGGTMKPDFIILNPQRGLLVLEVKDWKPDTIVEINRVDAVLLTESGRKTVKNPLEQAREYAQDLKQALERDPLLVHASGPYRGRLAMPWAYGVVLSGISRKRFNEGGLDKVIREDFVICSDELSESQSMEEFQRRLWVMFPWTLVSVQGFCRSRRS